MENLPKRPPEHIQADDGVDYCMRFFKKDGHVVRPVNPDYGLDLEVEVFSQNHTTTGARFYLQVKSVAKLEEPDDISYSCKTSTLNYYLQNAQLVLFVVYDESSDTAYWVWVQDYINANLLSKLDQATATIKLPTTNILDADSLTQIKSRVLKKHGIDSILTRIQTISDDLFVPHLISDGNNATITMRPKALAAPENEVALKGSVSFEFDESDEAQATLNGLKDLISTGKQVEVSNKFISKFVPPAIFEKFNPVGGPPSISSITLGSNPTSVKVPCKLQVLDNHNQVLAEEPLVELAITQSGIDEITYSNRDQGSGFEITIVRNLHRQEQTVNIVIDTTGRNVVHAFEMLKVRNALAEGKYFKLMNLKDRKSIISPIVSGSFNAVTSDYFQAIEKLAFVQEKLQLEFTCPEEIDVEDLVKLDFVHAVLTTGKYAAATTKSTVPLTTKVGIAAAALKDYKNGEKFQIMTTHPSYELSILGVKINLGPYYTHYPLILFSQEFVNQLDSLKERDQDEPIEGHLEIEEKSILYVFPNWIPKDGEQP